MCPGVAWLAAGKSPISRNCRWRGKASGHRGTGQPVLWKWFKPGCHLSLLDHEYHPRVTAPIAESAGSDSIERALCRDIDSRPAKARASPFAWHSRNSHVTGTTVNYFNEEETSRETNCPTRIPLALSA